MDVAAVGADDLQKLKSAALEMPRKGSARRGRASAIVPTSVFPSDAGPQREEEEEEEDDDI